MKTRLLILIGVLFSVGTINNVFAPPSPNEWPDAPYCPGGCQLDYLKQKWAEYYDYKGDQWMEMKKKEMFDAYNNGTLEKWLQTGLPTQNSNVHFYYYLRGEIPDLDGSNVHKAYGQQNWVTLQITGFDDSVPPTANKIFKIEVSPDMVKSIKTKSNESFDFGGFDIELKQNSTGFLEIKIPKNLPTPSSFLGFWAYDKEPLTLGDGAQIHYDVIEDPCYSYYNIPIKDQTNLEIVYSVITAGSLQLYSPIQFDKDNPCYDKVFYDKPLSPLKQFKSGIESDKVVCREGLELVIRTDHKHHPMCLTPDTKSKMIQRGLAMLIRYAD